MYCFEGRCIHKSIEEINRFRREHAGISQQEVILRQKTSKLLDRNTWRLWHLHWQVVTIPPPKPEAKAHWSEWSSWSNCESSCIVGAKGAQYRRRTCIVPNDASYSNSYCRGIKSETKICDFKCRGMRLIDGFASGACRYVSKEIKYKNNQKLYHY